MKLPLPASWQYAAVGLAGLIRRISEHEEQDTVQRSGLAMAA